MQVYLDGDMAYLAGLVASRGVLSESGGIRKIVIEFPLSVPKAPKTRYNLGVCDGD